MNRVSLVKPNKPVKQIWMMLFLLMLLQGVALAADVVPNGTFNDLTGWTYTAGIIDGTRALDASALPGGGSGNSLRYQTLAGRRETHSGDDVTDLTQTIDAADTVTLSFYWYKYAALAVPQGSDLSIVALPPGGAPEVVLWENTQQPGADSYLDGTVNMDVSSLLTATGSYQIVIRHYLRNPNTTSSQCQVNIDDLVLDVAGAVNSLPTLTPGVTSVSPTSVDRLGANTTTISTTFSDADSPGVGAFTVTFKVREPDNSTELTLVNAQTNGNGGLTITDNGGGSYTASYTYDPLEAQATDYYDLYCLVSDGTDQVVDDYADNTDELLITDSSNAIPTLTPGTTAVSATPVERQGSGTTDLSATFNDTDVPGVGAFTVTFSIREPDDITEVILVDALTNGNGGLTITDNGGGSYTATYTYDPLDAQTAGDYDLYFLVNDGTDQVEDTYLANTNELQITGNFAPTLTAGVTAVSVSPINVIGSNTTELSATFTDADSPAIGSFTVTIKVREPDDINEVVLVDALTDGNGGLTITDNGGGSYTATFTYDPPDAQAIGFYDLYFLVNDGAEQVLDSYTSNTNELQLIDSYPPVLVAGATGSSPASVDRLGVFTTDITVDFTDADIPGVGGFFVSFELREPSGGGIITLATALQHGESGMTITDGGGGSYTALIAWDPGDIQMAGYYDLSCVISDGTNQTSDAFADNLDELLVTTGGENNTPIIPADNTTASPAGVERIGANPTTVSCVFEDSDQPAVSSFAVTFRLRLPDDSTEIILADNIAHGTGGVTIVDGGAGIYTASISWDPPDVQDLGLYDLSFQVSDGSLTASDVFIDNEDELEIYDSISNQPVTLVATNTLVQPVSITRLGTDFTMLQSVFSDPDMPGPGGFTVTFKVRDTSSQETVLANAAVHGTQGVRIVALGGSDYQASMLWDPPLGQVTGTYDLYFEVSDFGPSTAIDDYADNQDELTVLSTAPAGDGNLLRRNHDSNNCGSPTSACHNLPAHQGQDCLICHIPHGSSNIFMVRESIDTPISGPKPVLLKTLGIGDPYNDPDPTPGDPNSGVMADENDGVFTNVCEVCHTATKYHRNDGSHPTVGHHNSEDCRACHSHAQGFPKPEGSGESGGGLACSCHSANFNPMNSSTSSYHHQLTSSDANYTVSAKTCLMCHVDHDIFRPDLNPGIGSRSKNLRVDITTAVTPGDATVLHNSDYRSAGTGGICLSCHTVEQTKGYAHPDGSTTTPPISKTAFDAATAAHNYDAPMVFTEDGSTFNANCVKCHNDTMTKLYQDPGNQFGAHDSPYRTLIDPLGAAAPADPLEEKHCLGCHSTTNPNAGSNLDYYGVQTMSTASINVGQAIGYAYAHPVSGVNDVHDREEDQTNLGDGTRHAECVDCHNVHEADQGTHDGSSMLVSNALKGVWGVEPTSWPAAPAASNLNSFATPAGYTRVEPALYEWQICLKCHSDYVTLPAGSPNLAEEINPNYPSAHGISAAGTNAFCNTTTMNEPWGSSNITYCSDCHRSDNAADPEGAHGSNIEHMLVATIVSDDTNGTPLCLVCHKATVYWDGGSADPSRFSQHPATKGAHQLPFGCFACHMWEYASHSNVTGVNHVEDLAAGRIYVHGMNKRFTLNERTGDPSVENQLADAFVDGYMANMDYTLQKCWSEVCKTHAGQGY